NGFFSHTSPTNGSFSTRVSRHGIRGASGENIAYRQRDAAAAVSSWMASSGHRANILNARYRTTGVGYAVNASGHTYYVQCFTSMVGM
ncbi:MAG: CAP domain-containing protein, partial [Bdellovibrionales bacterium]